MFLASDCMLFGSLIATYLAYRGKDQLFANGPYPRDVFSVAVTSISTFDLLMSSFTMVLAVAAIQRGDLFKTRLWLSATALLGAIFVGFQGYEFTHFYLEGLSLQGNLFGSSFYVLTGFHGTHVSIGVLWLLLVVATSFTKHKGKVTHLNVEVAGLYWHFVDIVWIAIFTLVYLMEWAS
ncbi:MAG: cytochrome c oxidase subunit 3 [Alphaproteobacteria bacterium]|nr:cytochrome c oxidase subunit 3 [Alphaproteobacteria bacterium]